MGSGHTSPGSEWEDRIPESPMAPLCLGLSQRIVYPVFSSWVPRALLRDRFDCYICGLALDDDRREAYQLASNAFENFLSLYTNIEPSIHTIKQWKPETDTLKIFNRLSIIAQQLGDIVHCIEERSVCQMERQVQKFSQTGKIWQQTILSQAMGEQDCFGPTSTNALQSQCEKFLAVLNRYILGPILAPVNAVKEELVLLTGLLEVRGTTNILLQYPRLMSATIFVSSQQRVLEVSMRVAGCLRLAHPGKGRQLQLKKIDIARIYSTYRSIYEDFGQYSQSQPAPAEIVDRYRSGTEPEQQTLFTGMMQELLNIAYGCITSEVDHLRRFLSDRRVYRLRN